jgi:hypothetical protein
VSVEVALDGLRDEIRSRGAHAYVVTVSSGGPHVVSAVTEWDGDRLACGAGTRTAANVNASAAVALLWPSADLPGYSLIVDGDAAVDGDRLVIRPTRAVLHRTAGPASDGPSCIEVLPAAAEK